MRPLLSVCIPTYNRAESLRRSLRWWIPQINESGGMVELVVSDNCSTDHTPQVIKEALQYGEFRHNRNSSNIGGGPNMHKLASEFAQGDYVWLVGDDDLPGNGAVTRTLRALQNHPDIDYAYINYRCLHAFLGIDVEVSNQMELEALCPPMTPDFSMRYVTKVKELAGINEHCFTPIYCSIMRRSMAASAFKKGLGLEPFSTLESAAGHAVYIVEHLFDRPGYYVGEPCLIVSDAISWLEYLPVYALVLVPELHTRFLGAGVDRRVVDDLRRRWLRTAGVAIWFLMTSKNIACRERVSVWRFWRNNWRYPQMWFTLGDLSLRYAVNLLPRPVVVRLKALRNKLTRSKTRKTAPGPVGGGS